MKQRLSCTYSTFMRTLVTLSVLPQVRVSANLRVYIMALEVDSSELLRVLKPSLPLERLHLDSYNTLVSDATLELISQQYNKTLTHFLLLRDDPDFPDLSVNRNEDPLVLLAWRCTQLAVLVIHGEFSLFILVCGGTTLQWHTQVVVLVM